MKRLYAALVFSGILFGICISTQIGTSTLVNSMIETLEEAENTAQLQSIPSAEEIAQKWENCQDILMTYTSHDELEKITSSINILSEHIECLEMDRFKVECKNAINELSHLLESELPILKNIL